MCGVVQEGHICPYRKSRQKNSDRQSDKFRKTKLWTNKSIEIRQRDKFLCQICLRNLYNTLSFLNFKTVEVHHITPINEDYNRRLDNDNLISLCSYHHKMADKGDIPREELYEIVREIQDESECTERK
jgi:predicted restriction endonuclease